MQGGAVGSKSYLMIGEIHRAAIIRTLTSPAAANQLAAGAIFAAKMTTRDLISPVAANRLAAGAFFPVKMAIQDLTSRDTQTLLAEAATAADST